MAESRLLRRYVSEYLNDRFRFEGAPICIVAEGAVSDPLLPLGIPAILMPTIQTADIGQARLGDSR